MISGMATFVLSPHGSRFPVGTTVGAYALSGNTKLAQLQPDDAPLNTAATTAVVASDGTTTFTGLADDVAYVAAAQVSGTWRRTNFRTPVAAATLLARRPSWRVRRDALGLR